MKTEKLRQYIREQLSIIFEMQNFEIKSAEQLAVTQTMNTLPRKGIADSINNENQLFIDDENKNAVESAEKTVTNNFDSAMANAYTAPSLTNMFEDASVNAGAGLEAQSLDRVIAPNTNALGDKTQEIVDLLNNNIERELTMIKSVGGGENMLSPTNSVGHF